MEQAMYEAVVKGGVADLCGSIDRDALPAESAHKAGHVRDCPGCGPGKADISVCGVGAEGGCCVSCCNTCGKVTVFSEADAIIYAILMLTMAAAAVYLYKLY